MNDGSGRELKFEPLYPLSSNLSSVTFSPYNKVCHECHVSRVSLTISDWEGVFQPIINIYLNNIYYDGECIRKFLMTLLTRDTLDTPCKIEVQFF